MCSRGSRLSVYKNLELYDLWYVSFVAYYKTLLAILLYRCSTRLYLKQYWYFWTLSTLTRVVYKWKNHFYEMKVDVGMSLHEKGRNKKMPTPRNKVTHNPIPTSFFALTCCLFVCLL